MPNKNVSYPIENSPLYKLSSKKKLSRLLEFSLTELRSLRDSNNYIQTYVIKNGKKRAIQIPKANLDIVHRKIATFLNRIKKTSSLHSGTKGFSNITNARCHTGTNQNVITADITKFYPSTSRSKVFNFFYHILKCSADIADLLSDLLTFENKIPTGSSISMPLAYFSNMRMFDELEKEANAVNANFTIYVDDLTFSGANLEQSFIGKIEVIVKKHGLRIKKSKTRFYKSTDVKLITGVAIKDDIIMPRNKHLHESHNAIIAYKNASIKNTKDAERILGKLSYIGSLDPRFRDKARSFRSEMKSH